MSSSKRTDRLERLVAELEEYISGLESMVTELNKKVDVHESRILELEENARDSSNAHQRALTDRVNIKHKLGML